MGLFDKIKKSQEKIKKSLEDKREQAKEDKINSDPELKDLWEKAQESSAQADKDMDDLLRMKGIIPDDDKDDD